MSRLSMIAALAFCVTSAANAQSSLGVTGAEFSFSGFSQSTGGTSFDAEIILDVAVTQAHGLQGDLAWIETNSGAVGRIGGHLYMTPIAGQKYGLFGVVGDANGRDLTYAAVGVEGMFEVTDALALGGYVGAGVGSADGLDVIFAGVEGTYALSDALRLDGGVQLTEYDEVALQAIGTEARLNVRYSPKGQPFAVTAGVVQDMLTGPDGAAAQTRGELKLSWSLGTINGAEPVSRQLRTADPFLPLIRRGIY
ncbi:MAG: hypothetical protein AAGM21_01835 [Pseudomonadota bacterium]